MTFEDPIPIVDDVDDSEDTAAQYAQLVFVLKHLACRKRIMLGAGKQLDELALFSDFPDLQLLWTIVWEHFDRYGNRLPPFDYIETALAQADEVAVDVRDQARALLGKWRVGARLESDFSDASVEELLREHLQETKLDELSTDLLSNTSDSDRLQHARTKIEQAAAVLKADPFSTVRFEQGPFSNLSEGLRQAVRTPLGVQFIDNILDGGARDDEALLFVGPSGGGKTLLSLQLAAAKVQQQRHVVYISTEQGLPGDLTVRLCTLATSSKRSVWEHGLDKVPENMREEIAKFTPLWNRCFHFLDLSPIDLNVTDLDLVFEPCQHLAEECADDGGLGLVVLDWWGALRDQMLMAAEDVLKLDPTRLRRLARTWLRSIKHRAKNLGAPIVVMHQMSGEAAGRSAKATPSTWQAQEDRNLNNYFDYAFAFGKPDSENNVLFNADKARAAARTKVRAHLNGKRCRFETLSAAEGGVYIGSDITDDTAADDDVPTWVTGED